MSADPCFRRRSRYARRRDARRSTRRTARTIVYLRRRFVPPPERFALLQEHVVTRATGSTTIAAQLPRRSRAVLAALRRQRRDAARRADRRRSGRRLRITLPEGIPGRARCLRASTSRCMIGPVVPVPVPQAVLDALTSVAGHERRRRPRAASSSRSRSATTRRCRPSSCSPAGASTPMLRVIIVVTVNGTPQVLMDGVITRQRGHARQRAGPVDADDHRRGPHHGHGPDRLQRASLPGDAGRGARRADPRQVRDVRHRSRWSSRALLIDVPIPTEQIPSQQGTDLEYIKQLADEVGYVFYVDPGPVPGHEHRLLGTGDQGRRAAAGAERQHGRAHQRRVAELQLRQPASTTLPIVFIQNQLTQDPDPDPDPDDHSAAARRSALIPPPLTQASTVAAATRPSSRRSQAIAARPGRGRRSRPTPSPGTGTLDVLRYGRVLKARQLVGVRGAGPAFDGLYYVKSVTTRSSAASTSRASTLTPQRPASRSRRQVPA